MVKRERRRGHQPGISVIVVRVEFSDYTDAVAVFKDADDADRFEAEMLDKAEAVTRYDCEVQ